MSPEQSPASTENEERIRRFLAIASHDLQSPLRHIAMYAEILLDDLGDKLDDEQLKSLQTILHKAETAQRLTKALMGFAGSTPQVVAAEIDLNGLVSEIWADMASDVVASDATLEHGGLPTIVSDPAIVRMALTNVIANALAHRGPSPAVVTIAAEREPAEITIRISDNGPGIAPEHQDKIFDAFWKLPQEGRPTGPGLGLTASRETLRALGGSIRLERSDAGGSRFAIRLPASRA
ncbi:sensor histidine kinase [Rhizobium grahamii]|uniref:histidine kinase n=1 Tax=Rhizobium grahamii TaxID=1120045 RepID=A0A370KV54_9HYPH|nr:HAMP domain-containing sensor histidine kinase [Rhizobium grahamii]RDJ15351.1 two-component sensor histidine kinase [Rhizobium grahamii]